MEKTKTFMRNYRKIIIVSFAVIILAAAGSFLSQMVSMRLEVTQVNQRQLANINYKFLEIRNSLEYFTSKIDEPVKRDLDTAYRVLDLETEDMYDSQYLTKLVGNLVSMDNLIVLDENRELINAAGSFSETDYKDPYYDELFSGTEGAQVVIFNKGSDTDQTRCVNCGDHYLLTQAEKNENLNISDSQIWQLARMCIGLDTNSSFAVVDKNDGTVIYQDTEELNNKSFDIETDRFGIVYIDDGNYFAKFYDNDELGVRLFALTQRSLVNKKIFSGTLLTVAVFLVALFILVAYVICLRQDALDPKEEYRRLGKYFLKSQTSRFRALAIVVGVILTVLFLLLINVNNSRYTLAYLDSEADNCVKVYEMYDEYLKTVVQGRDEVMYGRGRIASDFINRHNEYRNKKGMSILADALDVGDLTAADSEGQTEFTSSSLDNLNFLADPENSLYELKYALVGKEGVSVQGDGKNMDESLSLFAVPRRGEDEVADGMMVVTTQNGRSNTVYDTVDKDFHWLLEYDGINDDKQVFWVDNYGVIISEKAVDSDNTIDESTLQDGYCGTLAIDGQEYLSAVRYSDVCQEYMYVISPVSWFSSYAITSTLVVAVMYILAALWIWYDGLGSKYHFEKRKSKVKDADDWERTELYWEELTTGKKMGRIIRICIYAVTVCILVLVILAECGNFDDASIGMLLTSSWNKSVNGYSILLNIGIILLFFTGVAVIDNMLDRIEKIVGADGVTGCRLVKSVIKYIGAIVCAVIVITNFGVDAVAALASVGIIGLALSFGAQELVKDVIAGMFLLFEGNFKVGDMLDVDGNWYWIRSIGVRTTKLEAWGTVKIINNANMTGMVNIQEASEVVNCDIWIDNRYDVDMVEDIMRKELPSLKEIFPPEVSTPVYKGIQEMGAGRTLIRLRAYCPPLEQGWVGRELRHKAKQILNSHGIRLANESYNIAVTSMNSEQMKKELDEYRQRMTGEKPE